MSKRPAVWIAPLLALGLAGAAAAQTPVKVTIDLRPAALRNTTSPDKAMGAGIDGAQRGDIDRLFSGHNVARMRSAGLKPLTYRLRTELGIEAWHWGGEGTWSDPAHAQGYWVGDDRQTQPILTSWGYKLPRRGDTIDNANNNDYSRLTDGDLATFWKSNPYLDLSYTGEAEARPQWLVVTLDDTTPVDGIEIAWGEPYATRYQVQYWTGANDYDPTGRWVTFPHGTVTDGHGGTVRLKLGPATMPVRYVRVLLEAASGTAPAGATDVRDRLGYAVREVGVGRWGADGQFHDLVRHAPSHTGQTQTHVSSTDPWHRAIDRDVDLEETGFDRMFSSGLTNGLPMLTPVSVLFDNPENAAAEIRYLKRRGYPIRQIELGEEPDGQYGDPRDYGALYLQVAKAIRAIDPALELGGPSLQSGFTEAYMLPGETPSWTRRFVTYLRSRARLDDLQFLSFEHYPFDDICGDIPAKLRDQSRLMRRVIAQLRADAAPAKPPLVIAEYGFSAFSGRAMSEMPSALLMADIVGQFLSEGGQTAYLFGYPPNVPMNQHQACAGFGNMMLFQADPDGQAKDPMPSYFTARMLSGDWMQAGARPHRLYATTVVGGEGAVTAYGLVRPDGKVSLLLVNRDAEAPAQVALGAVRPGSAASAPLHGAAQVVQYSPAQYSWISDGVASHPGRDLPPERRRLDRWTGELVLPASSVTVVTVTPPR
ncbi:discoidin domain-containing protein [Phenylobacterium aquaticum]|uniref:discoidin domain-containing protein n=1 Tax=Phenylobacterium aquaticum TaxID=1763816 RepID=UPI001F5C12DE|nr:discoidin domain-containing protein [Phenylobacterium aquaticum]MCI3132670.1 discoidin domain-containing protein [Phenylobacterium aquaticum]